MKLASLRDGSPDGRLAVVSRDGARFIDAGDIAENLQYVIENWDRVEPALAAISERLNGHGEGKVLDLAEVLAPLGTAEDIAWCATWLASDEAGYVTGSDISVDGGRRPGDRWSLFFSGGQERATNVGSTFY